MTYECLLKGQYLYLFGRVCFHFFDDMNRLLIFVATLSVAYATLQVKVSFCNMSMTNQKW